MFLLTNAHRCSPMLTICPPKPNVKTLKRLLVGRYRGVQKVRGNFFSSFTPRNLLIISHLNYFCNQYN